MNVTPRDLNYFLVVAQHGRLAPAAEACHVTQPALTKAIRRLESECGLTLFERDARGMRLTTEGARFKEIAESLNKSYRNALRVAVDVRAQQSGLLRVGTTDTTRTGLVSVTLAALLRQRPGLRVSLQVSRADVLASAVEQGRLDVAVVPAYGAPPSGCEFVQVGEETHLPVMSAKHPLARRHQPSPPDLCAYGWIHTAQDSAGFQSLAALFRRFKLAPPTLAVEIDYLSETVLSLVQASDMLAMVPRSLFRAADPQGLSLISIPDFRIDCPIYCLSRTDTARSPLTVAFCDLVSARAGVW